ncbi:MAG TPA: efflux RND transporter periplasmic adaptor subunit [Phycisphaerales bacterium]|nr:efflux RND transporter periplasmic adaptor subunit [Phycisphaerales bacterium]
MSRFWTVIKWVAGIGLVVLIVCGGTGVFLVPKIQRMVEEQQKAAAGKAVQVAPATTGELIRVVSAPGAIKAKSSVQISARVAAKIEKLPFKAGESVKTGDIVVQLDANDLKAALEGMKAQLLATQASLKSAEAQLASEEAAIIGVKASLDNAQIEWERQQELFKTGDVSQADLDRAKAELDRQKSSYDARLASVRGVSAGVEAAKARVQIAEADVKRAQDNLEYTVIRSPIDGAITQLNVEVGELAVTGTMNNPGTVLMKIADLSEMLVEARLAEVDVNRVKEGQKAKVFINGFPDITFNGVLRRVGLESRVQTGEATTYFEAEVVLELAGQAMFAGLSANVDIETETIHGVILPSQAVMDKRVDDLPKEVKEGNSLVDQDKTFARVVYVMEDGKAMMKPVKVAGGNLTKTAIAEGVPEGANVIVGPFRVLQELTHNTAVRLEEEKKDKEKKEGEKGDTTVAAKHG